MSKYQQRNWIEFDKRYHCPFCEFKTKRQKHQVDKKVS